VKCSLERVLREGRGIPHAVIQSQAHEPAIEDVVVEVLDQLPLAADRVKHLEKERSDQLLGRNGRPAGSRIELLEARRHPLQRAIHHSADAAQRMILRHPLRRRYVAEDRFRLFRLSSQSLLRDRSRAKSKIHHGHIRPFSASC
jgi:hypothetical protein